MKVFRYEKIDYIAAETIEDAASFYRLYSGEDDFELHECFLQDRMWYGFNWDNPDIPSLVSKGDRTFEIKKDPRDDFEVIIELTFKEVIHIDNITEPCLISSTEF